MGPRQHVEGYQRLYFDNKKVLKQSGSGARRIFHSVKHTCWTVRTLDIEDITSRFIAPAAECEVYQQSPAQANSQQRSVSRSSDRSGKHVER